MQGRPPQPQTAWLPSLAAQTCGWQARFELCPRRSCNFSCSCSCLLAATHRLALVLPGHPPPFLQALQDLRSWLLERRGGGTKAHNIFADTLIVDLAAKWPDSMEAMQQVRALL